MKKNQLNLLPDIIKMDRRNQKIKKSLAGLTIVPLAMYGYMQFSMMNIQEDITKLNQDISAVQSLEVQIKNQETQLVNDERIANKLSKSGFPLHRFLLFTGLDVPDDMRIYEVVSDNFVKEREKQEEDGGQVINQPVSQSDADLLDGVETENLEQANLFPEQDVLYIRGAAISVESVGLFIQQIEEYDFVNGVELYDIQNYYNGPQSYKFFELLVDIK